MGNQVSQQSEQRLKFHIARGAEGAAALSAAERQDHYLEEVQDSRPNRVARQSMTYAANRISDGEAAALQATLTPFVDSVPFVLRSLRPTIVPLMPSADGGMPHTRPTDLVCLPSAAITHTTFVHELWHLHQRANYLDWVTFFRTRWKWQPYEESLPVALETQRRLNPDTLQDPVWIWDSTWVPVCLFLNPSTASFKETATWFYNVKTQRHSQELPKAMADFFSSSLSSSAYEHPCETSAYMITGPPLDCPAYTALIGRWNNEPFQ